MDRVGFVHLAAVGFALVVASFLVRGVSRLVVGRELAELLQAPLLFGGFVLLAYLSLRATLDAVGIWAVDDPDA